MDIRDYFANAQGGIRSGYDSGVSALLDRLGLEQRRTTMDIVLPAMAIFGVGIAAGGVLGLLFAPKRGEETRDGVWHRLVDLKDQSASGYERIVHGRNGAVEEASKAISGNVADRK